ncbi:phosphate/phosphite/phosphonate ABC transporter substrate-binding protein [Pseudoponticoccus marisrubri]|uniref:Phosphate ABC transporter substrate-binding protein n=1 Tax=Pseudoponticoccus marisrubri TaxID=1685382 RepID=A0A0W7WKS2_9RHOB|nr:PhnD/SsuA/transferrin family substrate-binding protein [Pseudoponticoccus marisrubri]KUF11216.1 hypothetical protein AVJ23_09205 [Pseudoponticoccus marisrubri]
MIAALPMYWRPETAASWRLFWRAVQAQLPQLPDLTAAEDLPADWYRHWRAPDLALSHLCGLPYARGLSEDVTYVGHFDFDLPGTPPGYYRSAIVTRQGEQPPWSELTLAYNSDDSQSGWGAARMTHPAGFTATLATGAHVNSARAIIEGRADIAFIDAVTLRILTRVLPDLVAGLQVHGHSVPTPGLPLIAARGTDPAPMRAALANALTTLPEAARADMGGPVALVQLAADAFDMLRADTGPVAAETG